MFFSDSGMVLENGVMGYTSYLNPKEILLAEYLTEQISWEVSGIPNNEIIMSIVIHELTHSNQRKWLGGLAWLILNIPGIDKFTLEKWAVENENAAFEFLANKYKVMRKQ